MLLFGSGYDRHRMRVPRRGITVFTEGGPFLASNVEYGYGIDDPRYKGQKKDSESDNRYC